MKEKRNNSNKWMLSLIFIIPIALTIGINLIASHPWDKYAHGGPLAYPPDKGLDLTSPTVAPNTGIAFTGTGFSNDTSEPVKIIAITPNKVPDNITFSGVGVTQKTIDGKLSEDVLAHKTDYNIHKFPYTLKAGAKNFYPVIELVPGQPGTYSIPGFYLNYEYKGKTYHEYYPDQITVKSKK